MNIQEEIHTALQEIKKKVSEGKSLTNSEMEFLLLTSLIEDEG